MIYSLVYTTKIDYTNKQISYSLSLANNNMISKRVVNCTNTLQKNLCRNKQQLVKLKSLTRTHEN